MSKDLTKPHAFFKIGHCYKVIGNLTFWGTETVDQEFNSATMDRFYRFPVPVNSLIMFLGYRIGLDSFVYYLFLIDGKSLVGPGVCSYEKDCIERFVEVLT